MNWKYAMITLVGLVAGCGGGGDAKQLPRTADDEAIKREQDKMRNQPGGPVDRPKGAK